jgi:beta-glucosidase/6-phospho-beta-glucosidase/beta-galactosidase
MATFPDGFLWGASTAGHQTFERTVKPSARWLGEVARRNGLD